MEKFKGLLAVITFVLVISLFTTPVFAAAVATTEPPYSDAEITDSSCFSVDAAVAYLGSDQKIKNAKSVFLYEMNTKTLMYAWQPDLQMAPSSFAKILTAIVAIENSNLDSAVTVSEAALADLPKSAVSVNLIENEVVTMQDLLYCLLVGSANDAASVIAQYISGGQDQFAEKMNSLAEKIGCSGSYFTNPHGLHDPQQVTTARDTAKILEYAMGNETFRTIFCSSEYSVPATNKSTERYLVTGNYMMSKEELEIYFDERVIGGRTGVANDNTRCLATIAKSETMELLSVVMGSESVYEEGGNRIRSYGGYNETKTLLDAGFTGLCASQILYDGQSLIQFDVPGGETMVTVCPHTNISTVLPNNAQTSDLNFRYSEDIGNLFAPIAAGDRVCTVEVWYMGLCLAETDLYAMNHVRDGSVVSVYVPKSINPWVSVALILALLLFSAALFWFFRSGKGRRIINRIRRKILKNKRNKRSK